MRYMTFRRNTTHMAPFIINITHTVVGRFRSGVGSASHIDAKGCQSPVWCLEFCVSDWC